MRKVGKIIGILLLLAVLGLVVYIMANGLGLVEGLDFGAGAYYYADIPQFEKYLDIGGFVSELPFWVYLLLFFAWGFLMFKLWIWIDKSDEP